MLTSSSPSLDSRALIQANHTEIKQASETNASPGDAGKETPLSRSPAPSRLVRLLQSHRIFFVISLPARLTEKKQLAV